MNLVGLPLAPAEIGRCSAMFSAAVFDKRIGDEWFLCLLDDPEWALRYGTIREVTMFASTFAVITAAGPLPMVMWRFVRGSETFMHREHYIDAMHEPARAMLRKIEAQLRLKVVLRDNRSGETTGFWEFDNNFEMGEVAEKMAKACAGLRTGPFDERIALVQREYSIEALIALAERSAKSGD